MAVFLGPVGEVCDECFDLLARGLTQGFSSAEIDCVGLHQLGIELVLANELAKAIANSSAVSISGMAVIAVGRLWRQFANRALGRASRLDGTDFFYRADTDPIGFAQCSIHGAGFCNTHFCTAYQWRDVRRIGVTIASKSWT